MNCATFVCIQGRYFTCFWSVRCLGLSKSLTIGFSQTTINVINVKICVVVLHIELYLLVTLSVTLTLFQSHSSVKQTKLKHCRVVKYMKKVMNIFLTFAHMLGR